MSLKYIHEIEVITFKHSNEPLNINFCNNVSKLCEKYLILIYTFVNGHKILIKIFIGQYFLYNTKKNL